MAKTQQRLYLLATAIALLTFAVYLPALQHQFVDWDDGTYIFNNPNLRSLDLHFIQWAFSSFYAGNWHPLTWFSHGLDWAAWGNNPFGHHLVNNLIHALTSSVVTILVFRTIYLAGNSDTTTDNGWSLNGGPLMTAGIAGILFGLHPIHVESVAWAAERKDLLCALFFCLALLSYLHSDVDPKRRADEAVTFRFLKFNLPCFVFFVLALLSKPMAVTLPLILLLFDWYPLRRVNSPTQALRVAVEKLPFFALSLASAVLTILSQSAGGAIKSVPIGTRLAVAGTSLIAYLGKLIFPLQLVPFYPYPDKASVYSFQTLAAIGTVLGISGFCLIKARQTRLWLALWAYYVITLLPVLGIIQVGRQAMADRYSYLPSLAPFLLTGLTASYIAGQWKYGRRLVFVLSLAVTVLLCGLTLRQLRFWQDSISLWSYVISTTPDELDFAYNNRAIAWHRLGQLDKAAADFEMAYKIKPTNIDYLNNRGTILSNLHRYDEALVTFERAITLMPADGRAYYNIACIHSLRNETAPACAMLRLSIERGYDRWQEIKSDHDLDNIRSAECYREIIGVK